MFSNRILLLVFMLFFAITLILGGCTPPTLTTTYTITSSAGKGGQINPEGEVMLSSLKEEARLFPLPQMQVIR